ncbi:Phosphopantetheine adenylyltransferase [Candidatus Xiphinematobacter sp. Idaho Grape]|nr:Phosphopantetheine adenylyltransferase [Candidatus Xiphinematobacter sp. Idaho Grape]
MGMKRALYPGSFDPITNGHLDVIYRAAELFEEIVVAVAVNDSKCPLFSAQERAELVYQSLHKGIHPVRVLILEGLLAEFAWKNQIQVVIRGLRAVSDFEFEFQMALMNRHLCPKLETVFLTPQEDYTYLSSRLVKEVALLGGDVSRFVSAAVATRLKKIYAQRK